MARVRVLGQKSVSCSPVPLRSRLRLQRRPDGLFSVVGLEQGADFPSGPKPTRLTAGALEGSNVNALDVMIKLMDQSRSFEQQINMIKETKANDESGASMMKAA